MAIAVVDTASGTADGASSVTSSAVTISGTNRYLLVAVGFNNDNLETISSVVLDPGGANQTALTLIPNTAIASDDDGRVAFYGVANPPTGDLTVRVTLSTSLVATREAIIYVWALTGVDQASPIRDVDTDAGQNVTSLSLSLTTVVGDEAFSICFVEELETNHDTDQPSPHALALTGGTKTEVVGGYDGIGVTNVTASSTTTAFGWSITGGDGSTDPAAAAVALAPAEEEPAIGVPTNVQVTITGERTATVTWDEVEGATHYQVEARVRAGVEED